MTKELELDGKSYITSKRAAEITGYAQDYIGQLARGGEIDAQKIDGAWYVVLETLLSYEKTPETPKFDAPKKDTERSTDTIVSFDGKEFISSKRGAELSGYSQDYVGQLARGGRVLSRQVGSKWYVAKNELLAHKEHNDALLAAVQTESVGLHKTAVAIAKPKIEEPKVLLTYHNEAAFDLMPMIQEKNEALSNLTGTTSENSFENHASASRESKKTSVVAHQHAPIEGEDVATPITITATHWQPVPVTVSKKKSVVDFWETGVPMTEVEQSPRQATRRRIPKTLHHRRIITTAALAIALPALFVVSAMGMNALNTQHATTLVAQTSSQPYIDAKNSEMAAAAGATSNIAAEFIQIIQALLSKKLHFER